MPPAIKWTPKDEASERTLTFPRNPTKFSGYRDTNAAQSVTLGGVAVTVLHDAYSVYELELRSFGPSVDATFFSGMTAWWSHAAAGGEWKFLFDSGDYLDTTMSASTIGATTFSVTSTSTLAVNDWIFLEDANDHGKFESAKVSNISASTITVVGSLSRGYASGSTVRHMEYFPACLVLGTEVPFKERMAGQGNRLYDMTLKFRTVR